MAKPNLKIPRTVIKKTPLGVQMKVAKKLTAKKKQISY